MKKKLDPKVQGERAWKIRGGQSDCVVCCIGKEGAGIDLHAAPTEVVAMVRPIFAEYATKVKEKDFRRMARSVALLMERFLASHGIRLARQAYRACHPKSKTLLYGKLKVKL